MQQHPRLVTVSCTMQSLTVRFMFVVTVAHAAAFVKKPFLKASELQREFERVSTELTGVPKSQHKTREIQTEIEFMVNRVKSLHDSDLTSEFAIEIESIEEALSKETTDKGLTTEINEVRASFCAQSGFENHDFASCEDFMRKTCAPAAAGDTKYSDDALLEDFCVIFFHEGSFSGIRQAAVATAAAPAPGPAASPGPAAPAGPLFGGKSLRALPDQGVTGQLVKHVDFDTMSEDWQKEFGPQAGHRKFDEICADFPDNQWCRMHGYLPSQARKTKVVTKTIMERAAETGKKLTSPDAPERSGTNSCQLTLVALFTAVAMFAK